MFGDREEYADSEKYEIRIRDWNAPGNIRALITTLNRLRRQHPALQSYEHLRFEGVSGERVLFYRKALPDGEIDPLTGELVHDDLLLSAALVAQLEGLDWGIGASEVIEGHDPLAGLSEVF